VLSIYAKAIEKWTPNQKHTKLKQIIYPKRKKKNTCETKPEWKGYIRTRWFMLDYNVRE
jgi:hypothetical protein